MPEITPFIAASPGALKHLQQNPAFQKLLKEGIFKDIWGSEWQGFMGIGGDGDDSSGILDNPQGRNTSFAIDVSVYRCVDIRGASIASVPLKVYDSQDPSTRKEVQHEALDVLQQANPFNWVAGPDLLRYSLGSRDLHGNFAWSIVYDRGGRLRGPVPRELYWLPPAQYKPVAGADLDPPQPKVPFAGLKVTRKTKSGSVEDFIPAQNVVYAPTYSPTGDLRGTSKITATRMDINLRTAGQNSNWWFFQNNQRPDVVITGAFSPTSENVNFLQRIWKARFGGDKNRGPVFLPQDMKVQLLTMGSKDAEWLGQRQSAREDILAAFGVPPPVYGDLSRATYENIRVAEEGFWRNGMIPDLDQMSAVLTYQFLRRWPDAANAKLWMCFDYAQIEALQEDANAIWERGKATLQEVREWATARLLLPNQARMLGQAIIKMMGLPDAPFAGKVPGGDMFYVRLQEIPIIEASVQASIDTNAARAAVTGGETNRPGNGQWVLPDASQVTARLPAADQPQRPARPQPSKVMIHNHLTRLEWPSLPEPTEQLALKAAQPEQSSNPFDLRENRLKTIIDWLVRRFKRYFQDLQTLALRNIRGTTGGHPNVETLWDQAQAREEASNLVRQAALMAVDAAYDSAAQDYKLRVVNPHNDAWLAKYMGSRLHMIQGIDDTTRKAVRKTLLEGAQNGEGIPQLAQRVRAVFVQAIDSRALTIARTEVLQAHGMASLAAYEQANLTQVRMYDGTTYDALCAETDGRVVSISEARALMEDEHPNGTRGVAPVISAAQAA